MSLELSFLLWLQSIHTPFWNAFWIFWTRLGDAALFWIGITLILFLFPRTRKAGCIVLLALAIELLLCNVLLKPLVARPRPFDASSQLILLIEPPSDFSFPSGHTAASFAVISALFYARNRKLALILLAPALCISFSRLYLGVHYPSDVLFGAILGWLGGYLGWRLAAWIDAKYLHQANPDQNSDNSHSNTSNP